MIRSSEKHPCEKHRPMPNLCTKSAPDPARGARSGPPRRLPPRRIFDFGLPFGALRYAVTLTIALLCAPSPALLNAAQAPRIRLAGTFNNWSTGDNDYALRSVGGALSLDRFWSCGVYEFKFVFDGSWDRHFGAADSNGALTQPGANISLIIPQSGTYRIALDVDKRRWTLRRRPPDKPVSYIRVVGAETGAADVYLDGTLSEPTRGRTIESYDWKVLATDGGQAMLEPTRPGELPHGVQKLTVKRAGRFGIELTVSDGKRTGTTHVVAELGRGWKLELSGDAIKTESKLGAVPMLPTGGGDWAAVCRFDQTGNVNANLRPAVGDSDAAPVAGQAFRVETGRSYLVRYDAEHRSLQVQPEGFCDPNLSVVDVKLSGNAIVERVDVVGDFNGWRTGATPMIETFDAARRFIRILELPDGVHHYKLLVNGTHWIEDPRADPALRAAAGNGTFNSGVRIGPDPASLGPARPDDINCGALRHDPANAAYFMPIDDDLVRLTVRTLKDDVDGVAAGIEKVDGNLPLAKTDSRGGFDYWSATCRIKPPNVTYTFTLRDGTALSLLDSNQCRKLPSVGGEPFSVQTAPFETEVRMRFKTPDWAKRAVWYQIFPERFRNGDPKNDPPRTVPWTHEWFKPYGGTGTARGMKRHQPPALPESSGQHFRETGTFHEFIYDRRYGGDLQGVREQLPYLRRLGVTAIYFNPIFLAESLHKYDASDFRHIDDFFGVKGSLRKVKGETTDPATWQWSESDKVFLDFLQEAHRQGFRVIIDGVFNHVGRDFWAFKDVRKHGRRSAYAGWFDVTSWKPFHYKAWDKDDGSLPRLKHDDALGLAEPVREHLFAVTHRWMDPNGDGDPSDGIDGWRLDVASDINENFWKDWRKRVKSINPDAYIVAELWEESKAWLDGRTFDAVMNYPFARSAQRFFVNDQKRIKPSEFARQIQETLGWYPPQVNYVLQNLYDSHDTDRVASMFMNPDLEYDQANRLQDNGPNYNSGKPTPESYHRQKLMATYQMMFLGAPMIYYGDEVGMYGADDPTCRKPMLWPDLMPYDDPEEKIERDVLEHYRRMIAIRNSCPPLQLGSFEVLATDDHKGIFAFARTLSGESIVVVFNNSDHAHRLDLPSPWPDGATIVRLDDPHEAELVEPPADDPAARPRILPKPAHHGHVRVENGRLHGVMLAHYTAAVLARVGN